MRRILLSSILVIVIWTIVTVELTLNYNLVTGVYNIGSTGQLIPLIIGIVGICKMISSIFVGLIKKFCMLAGYCTNLEH